MLLILLPLILVLQLVDVDTELKLEKVVSCNTVSSSISSISQSSSSSRMCLHVFAGCFACGCKRERGHHILLVAVSTYNAYKSKCKCKSM